MKGYLIYQDNDAYIQTGTSTHALPGDVDLDEHTPIQYDEETQTVEQRGEPPKRPIPSFDDATPKTKHDHRYAYLRTQNQRHVFTVQHSLIQATHDYYTDAEHVFTPCILGTASESGSDVFPVYYYGEHAYLRQDPQLHRQLCIVSGAKKIYEVGPAWRAEQSHTSKHLSEHRVIAVEHGYIESMQDVINDAIAYLKHVTDQLEKEGLIQHQTISSEPPQYTFTEAKEICAKHGVTVDDDLTTEAEQVLYEHTKEESDVVIVTHYPDDTKPFYVMRKEHASESFDIIYKGTEISSGGQREHRHDELLETIKEKGMNPETVEWFTDAFTYGAPTHGGFAIGIERLTALLTDTKTVKDTTYFPRDPNKLVP